MQTDQTQSNNEQDIHDIRLEPGIYNLTIPIRNHLENDIPIPEEEMNVLKTFDKEYSFEKDIQERGREAVLQGLNEASKYFNFEEAKLATAEGLKMAQAINPDAPIKPFPIVFLYIPRRGDAKSLHGQGCGINIDALQPNNLNIETPFNNIKSYTAHESVHVFLRQLRRGDENRDKKNSFKNRILDFIWEEGLTTYIESIHYPHHYDIENDALYWIDITNQWLNTTDSTKKDRIFENVKRRPSFLRLLNDMYHKSSVPSSIDASEDGFNSLIRDRNGVGYHMGSYLWKKELEKAKQEGKTLKDLVMAGSSQMERWITE